MKNDENLFENLKKNFCFSEIYKNNFFRIQINLKKKEKIIVMSKKSIEMRT